MKPRPCQSQHQQLAGPQEALSSGEAPTVQQPDPRVTFPYVRYVGIKNILPQ